MKAFMTVIISLLLGSIVVTTFGADGESAKAVASRIRNNQASRASKVTRIESWLKSNPDSPHAVMLEHLIAELYRGEYCNEPMDMRAWRGQLEHIVSIYGNREETNIFVLEVMVTYAQLIADSDPDRSAQMFKQVMESPPDDIEVPSEYIWASLGKEVAINRLKQGAIWAILNDRTRSVTTERDKAKRKAVLEQAYSELKKELSTTKEGRRCVPLAKWWYDVAVADDMSAVVAPRLESPHVRTEPEEVPVRAILEEKDRQEDVLSSRPTPQEDSQPANPIAPHIEIRKTDERVPWAEADASSRTTGQYLYWTAGCLAGIGALLIVAGIVTRRGAK